ncbi:MAG: MBL fold metallo-hydrolase [Acidobacteria bacterium]|nr:MBL fold metallo-hydrolase [Acidobacteriota bacterium]
MTLSAQRGGRGAGPGDAGVPTEQQWSGNAETQKRVAAAMKMAGTDLVPQAKMFCTATGPLRMAVARQRAGLPPMPNVVVEPTRVFDNMYWIGMTSQNVWAITTSDGIILLDTMNSTDEARDVIVAGMKKVGLDPAQITYIVVGHGHPGQSDHTGGALYLQKTYGAKVVMNPIDAKIVLPAQRLDRPLAVPDIDAYHGQKLTLGDTTLTLVHIPGHTPGTMGVIVPVKLRGAPHTVIVLAATQMPTPESLLQFERVFTEFAKPMKVEASLNMHANGVQEDLTFLEAIRKNPSGPTPYLYGPERFSRWMDIMIECGRARLAALGIEVPSQSSSSSASRPLVSEARYEAWQKELSNWGRWGTDDELGTLNLITPAKRRAAMALAREGVTVSLSANVFTDKASDVPCPAEWAMTSATQTGATDRVAFPCIHGAASTHIDSLAHTFFGGRMWNGYDTSTLVTTAGGAWKNSVLPMKGGIVTRGVLYDVARLKGVPYLAPGDRIFVEDLEAWEKKAGVRVGPGDALVLRWGRYGRRARLGPDDGAAGLDNSVLPWLKQRDIALLVWETAGYSPQLPGDLPRNAVHNFVQAILGIHVLDRADLEALGEAAAARKRWDFLLMVNPLALPNATGSPVNPVAMF